MNGSQGRAGVCLARCAPHKKQHLELSSGGFIIHPWVEGWGTRACSEELAGGRGPSHRPVSPIVPKGSRREAVPALLRDPSLHVVGALVPRPHNHGVPGCHGWVLGEEVEGPEQEAHGVARGGSVGDVL